MHASMGRGPVLGSEQEGLCIVSGEGTPWDLPERAGVRVWVFLHWTCRSSDPNTENGLLDERMEICIKRIPIGIVAS